jgi:hypothetical protein
MFMNQINDYRTVQAELPSELDKIVNKLIEKGWQPFGSPYVSSKTNDFDINQTMVLYAKIPQGSGVES